MNGTSILLSRFTLSLSHRAQALTKVLDPCPLPLLGGDYNLEKC